MKLKVLEVWRKLSRNIRGIMGHKGVNWYIVISDIIYEDIFKLSTESIHYLLCMHEERLWYLGCDARNNIFGILRSVTMYHH